MKNDRSAREKPGAHYSRVTIEGVHPEIDGGRFAIKRVPGERVVVEADIFTDGHDALFALLLWKPEKGRKWREAPFEALVGDRWRAEFTVSDLGRYRYTIEAWIDPFVTWRRDLEKRRDAAVVTGVDLIVGAEMIAAAMERATTSAGRGTTVAQLDRLGRYRTRISDENLDLDTRVETALDDDLAMLMAEHPDRSRATRYERELEIVVDPPRARFSTWYEMFPRSCTDDPARHGTLRDCEARLPYLVEMGIDVLYLPPIHPIGHTARRGKNNRRDAGPDDVGSPWAIGSEEGGHKAVHPDLGTIVDFRHLLERARAKGIEVAMDLAYQCSPDHPWVKEHPEWFRRRPDGSIQYAENPPKKYDDIYPIDFDTPDADALWNELKSVVEFWIDQGVRIFRVDNPHTKPFAFWEWMIGEIKAQHPETIFLAEAFTRPRVMYRLAKLGFTQSYTYFTWRNARWELEQYLNELTRTEVREYFRPNFWPNTPDILSEYLQTGGRPAFVIRLVLAATMSPSYGIYGPAFELCENTPREPESEEYLDSEKYQIRVRDLDASHSLAELMGRINRIRHDYPALQQPDIRFHPCDNERIICYSRGGEDDDVIVVVVNLDPHYRQSGWIDLPLSDFGLEDGQSYQMHDLVGDARYVWQGAHNYVELDPHVLPAHIFRMHKHVRVEQDFDYFS